MPSARKKPSKKRKKPTEIKTRTPAHNKDILTATREKPGLKRYAFFSVGKQRYAVDVDRIVEVLHQFTIEPVSHLPEAFLGVIHLRGVSIPVVDLPYLLREEKIESIEKTCLIAMLEREQIGLLIDSDINIIMSDEGCVHMLPDCYTKEEAQFIDGILALDNDFMAIINPNGIIRTLTDWKVPDA
jgi:purine-binding chemotaxis protein CheW